MMPWEHVIVGYIGYSLLVHAVRRRPPTSPEALVVAFAALFPDLIDKPLAWGLGVFTSGYGIAHSIFLAVPLGLAIGWLAWASGRPWLGGAFAAGHLLHLAGDLASKYIVDGELVLARVLWPVRTTGDGYETGFLGEFWLNLAGYGSWLVNEVVSGNPDPYLYVILAIGLGGTLLWVYDGMPVGRDAVRVVREAVRSGR